MKSHSVCHVLIKFCLIINLSACSNSTEIPKPETLSSEYGIIEFHNLKNTSAKEIASSIKRINPELPIYACAQIMVDSLGFAKASVLRFPVAKDSFNTIVTILEKSLSAFSASEEFSQKLIPKWSAIRAMIKNSPEDFAIAQGQYYESLNNFKKAINDVEIRGGNSDYAQRLWNYFNDDDKTLNELSTILNSKEFGVIEKRIAVSLLIKFYHNDEAFNIMLGYSYNSLIEQDVTSLINSFRIGGFSKQIDWAQSKSDLRNLIAGENPWILYSLFDFLAATKISPKLSKSILKDNWHIPISYLNGREKKHRNIAYNFLKQISQKDFGYDSKKWSDWCQKL